MLSAARSDLSAAWAVLGGWARLLLSAARFIRADGVPPAWGGLS
jgi:hypothetical protein